ncbi:DUF1800 domain-containing protein [Agrobacterium sp. a22-2]|uniref:DUF1800 domain-containing protein n=1 Tax=Agrobacterium sp. a22-2 TaxID=2283840 RepID=UPI001444E174|nr:DUF1800 domain-containing protein [Agrobacterium sp. a22-2]NKN37621.1 DUF1800 domain-containing protein [Agrobacterium sp. a22-2]
MSLSVSSTAAMRFGYGLRPSEPGISGPDELLAQVERGAAAAPLFPREGLAGRREQIVRYASEFKELRLQKRRGEATEEQSRAINKELAALFRADSEARIAQAVLSPNGFHERLASFWTNHFAIGSGKNPMMRIMVPAFEAEVVRPLLAGRFSTLVQTVSLHPAMMIYLDQTQSTGPNSVVGMEKGKGINENFARELIELHTLGVGGGYTQNDVRQAAYVLSGLAADLETMEVRFQPRRAEPGRFTVLGKTYGGEKRAMDDCLDLIDDLSAHPSTAVHICRKLAVHFVSDEAPQALIDAMMAAWSRSDGDLFQVYRALVQHPSAWENPGGKIKLPFDYVVSSLRAFDADEVALSGAGTVGPVTETDGMMGGMAPAPMQDDQPSAVPVAKSLNSLNVLRRMGQQLWAPPSPAGFEDDSESWMNANQLTERIGWARRLSASLGKDRDPREFATIALADAARDETIRIIGQAPSKAIGITLVLASPEFNRR